jgi:hypothetical protein
MRIELETGQKLELPDGSTPDQIDEVVSHFQSSMPQQDAPQPKRPDVDLFDTVGDKFLQGATFGIGNRAQAGLAALALSAINDKPIAENYKDARELGTARLAAEQEQNPKTSIGANIVGAVGTGGLAAGTKLGAATGNLLRGGNLAARVGKGAVAGAASGAAYGAGTAEYDKSLERAGEGAVSGALVGGAIPVAGAVASDLLKTGKNAVIGAFAKSPEAVQDAAKSLLKIGGNTYEQMRQVGATFKPSAVQGFLLKDVDTAIAKNNFIPALNPKTTAIIDDLKQKAASGGLGLDQLDQYRRMLGRIGGSEDGVSAGAARKAIDDFVNSANSTHLVSGDIKAVSLLNKGRAQYAQASKYDDIADILAKADGDPNKIKAGLTRFWKNTDNTRGWTQSEIATLKDAASGSGVEKLLKMGGKFGVDLGSSLNVGNTVAPLVGYGVGGGVAPIAGTAARVGQKLAARGKAQNLLNVLEGGGNPMGQGGNAISPLLSAPGGATAGAISINRSRRRN